MKNCLTCRWASCSNYGKNRPICTKYIPSLEEERGPSKKMTRLEKAFTVFKGEMRSEIVDDRCPHEMDESLEDFDIDTYRFPDDNVERGCRGITCEKCWDKPLA